MKNTVISLAKKINPNLYWSFASKGLAAVGFFTVDIIIARNLGVAKYGQWTTFTSIMILMIGILSFGIPQASQALNARNDGNPRLKGFVSGSLIAQASISFVFVVIIFFMRNYIADIYQKPFFADLVVLSLPYLFLYSGLDNIKFNFVGLKRVHYHFVLNIFEFSLKVSLVLILLESSPTISRILGIYSISTFIPYLVGIWILTKIVLSLKGPVQLKDSIKTLIKFSAPFILLIIIQLSRGELNIQLLSFLTNDYEVAMLGIGKQITSKIPQLTMAITMGTIPKLANITKENFEEKRKYLFRIFYANFIFVFAISAFLFFAAPFIVNNLYGGQFSAAILPFRISLIFAFILSITYYLSLFIDVQGETIKRVLISLFSLVILFVSSLILIPGFGAVGAAISSLISAIPAFIFTFLITKGILKKIVS